MITSRIYRSTDAGAPQLTGQAGSLIAVLDACLVAGYGTKTAAGWAKEFTGANQAAYRPATGRRLFLFVNDSFSKSATVFGYESMSAIDAGIRRFPNARQVPAAGPWIRKSTTADAVARPWYVVAGATFVYVVTELDRTVPAVTNYGSAKVGGMFFGDLECTQADDAYAVALIANNSTDASGDVGADSFERLGAASNSYFSGALPAPGHWIARPATGVQGASPALAYKMQPAPAQSSNAIGSSHERSTRPNPFTRAAETFDIFVYERLGGGNSFIQRGTMPAMRGLTMLPATSSGTAQYINYPVDAAVTSSDKRVYKALPVNAPTAYTLALFREDV